MSYKSFPSPVRIFVQSKQQESVISSAWDAVEFLLRWPGHRGAAYRRALQHCLDALDGILSPKKAWNSFCDAAREEGFLAA